MRVRLGTRRSRLALTLEEREEILGRLDVQGNEDGVEPGVAMGRAVQRRGRARADSPAREREATSARAEAHDVVRVEEVPDAQLSLSGRAGGRDRGVRRPRAPGQREDAREGPARTEREGRELTPLGSREREEITHR
jgi:hypothetical protein